MGKATVKTMLFALASAAFTNKTGESQVLQAKTMPDTPTTNYTDPPTSTHWIVLGRGSTRIRKLI